METSGKAAKKRSVIKPAPQRARRTALEPEQQGAVRQSPGRQSIDQLPAGPGTQAMRQAAVLQMQRTHGNAHVMRQLDPSILRQDEDGTAGDTAGPSAISGSGGRVDAGGGGVEITGGTVKVHSGYTEVDGVLKTNTLIADNVVGSNYTPGAGNIW